MKEQLLHILDQSTCLTRRQMKDYLGGTMLPEEVHAAEQHIASCPLCSMAIEGFEAHSEEALEAIGSLNSGFLKEHFDAITPQIHLNSLAPATVAPRAHYRKPNNNLRTLWRVSGVAAALLLGFGVLWFLDARKEKQAGFIAQQEAAPATATDKSAPVQSDHTLTTLQANEPPAAPQNAPVAAPVQREPQPVVAAPVQKQSVQAEAVADQAMPPSPDASGNKGALAKQEAAKEKSDKDEDRKRLAYAPTMGNSYNPQDQLAGNMATEKTANAPRAARYAAPATASVAKEDSETATRKARSEQQAYKAEAAAEETDHLQKGDELYGKASYSAALAHYKSEMNTGSRSRKAQAGVMAARCYQQLGQKDKAISLLQQMVSEGGPQKRAAKRMLRELGKEE